MRASSPALRATDDDRATVTVPVAVADVDVAFAITVVAPTADLALFAAAVARKRLAPLGRFARPTVPLLGTFSVSVPIPTTPSNPSSRSTRRRNGLGKFSSSCRLYIGGGGTEEVKSLEETVWVLPDEVEDDDDEDDDEEEPALVVVGSSDFVVFAAGASTRLAWAREDTDGRRRRLVR